MTVSCMENELKYAVTKISDGDTTMNGQRYIIVDNINATYAKPSLMDLKVLACIA